MKRLWCGQKYSEKYGAIKMLDEHFCIQLQGQKRINLGKYKVISDQTLSVFYYGEVI